MSRFPQRPDLLFLALSLKDVLLYAQPKKVLEVFGFGIVEASLPLADGAVRDSQQVGQVCLRQANAHAQLQHGLPKGIVALTMECRGMGVLLAFLVTRQHPTRNAKQQGRNMPPDGG